MVPLYLAMEVPPPLTRESGPVLLEKCHAPYDCVSFFNTAVNGFDWLPTALFGDKGEAHALPLRHRLF